MWVTWKAIAIPLHLMAIAGRDVDGDHRRPVVPYRLIVTNTEAKIKGKR